MKKIFLYLLLFSPLALCGQDVSEQTAVMIANAYSQKMMLRNANSTSMSIIYQDNRKPELFSPLGKANMWLVPVANGWMLLSSNKKATPILAYLPSFQKPVYDSLPPAAQDLIAGYENYIAYVNKYRDKYEINNEWQIVESGENSLSNYYKSSDNEQVGPLLTSVWNQSGGGSCDSKKIYNKFCPYINDSVLCNRAVAGCVAVAIAQIMRYWNWPYSALIPLINGGEPTELKLYDWSQMPDSIYSGSSMSQVDMTAGFLRDCGFRLHAKYDTTTSATTDSAYNVLKAFGYDQQSMELRYKFLTPGWTNKLRSNIDAGQPVFYSGDDGTNDGGHAFVVDGYLTGNSPIYHINWGWGGRHNGWFNIDSAYVDEFTHYELYQQAIFGIRPAPICADLSLINSSSFPSLFSYAIGGELTISNATIDSLSQGQLYSSTQVRLTSGVTLKRGSIVHIAIKDMYCQQTRSNESSSQDLPLKVRQRTISEQNDSETFAISPNPVSFYLRVHTQKELRLIRIYTITGQCVLQTNQTDIDVSSLPQGMYILRAITSTGDLKQAKFIKE